MKKNTFYEDLQGNKRNELVKMHDMNYCVGKNTCYEDLQGNKTTHPEKNYML